jgi:hypothetical protein
LGFAADGKEKRSIRFFWGGHKTAQPAVQH